MPVLSHWPAPATSGVMTNGAGSSACPATSVSGATGRLNATVMGLSRATPSAPFAGCVLVTSRKPAVANLNATGWASFRPAALVALLARVTWYSAPRFSRSVGEKVNRLPSTFTSPGTCGSMLKAELVLAGSIGWSNVTITGAESTCSSPRSGVTLTTMGGSGSRVGVGAGWLAGGLAGWPAGWLVDGAVEGSAPLGVTGSGVERWHALSIGVSSMMRTKNQVMNRLVCIGTSRV